MCEVLIKRPLECDTSELKNFESKINEGGEVSSIGLENRIKQALALAFCYDGNQLVAVAALKKPNDSYKERVFKQAEQENLSNDYDIELGWIFTSILYRKQGIARNMVQELLRSHSSTKIFATTRKDNCSMINILCKYGFISCGIPYSGEGQYEYEVQVYTYSPK